MPHALYVFTLVIPLCAWISTAACDGRAGACPIREDRDQTSLMQVQSTFSLGSKRSDRQPHYTANGASQQEGEVGPDDFLSSSDQMVDKIESSSSTGECQDMGCFGTAPFCGGNENDCTSRGFTVKNYDYVCGGEPCESGTKVRCELCTPAKTGETVPRPTDPPPPTTIAPTAAPPTPPPPTTASPPTPSPPGPSIAGPATVAPLSLNETSAAVQAALDNVAKAKEVIVNATTEKAEVGHNISVAAADRQEALQNASELTAGAVRAAEKRALANQSVIRAQRILAEAVHTQESAQNTAVAAKTKADMLLVDKMNLEKLLVDKIQKIHEGYDNLEEARITRDRAIGDNAVAQKQADWQAYLDAKAANKDIISAAEGNAVAKKVEVKTAMEDAYMASSPGTNESTVPMWGKYD